MERYLNEKEALEFLKTMLGFDIKMCTFRNWRYTGKLRHFYFVRKALFKEEHLIEDINNMIKAQNTKRAKIRN